MGWSWCSLYWQWMTKRKAKREQQDKFLNDENSDN